MNIYIEQIFSPIRKAFPGKVKESTTFLKGKPARILSIQDGKRSANVLGIETPDEVYPEFRFQLWDMDGTNLNQGAGRGTSLDPLPMTFPDAEREIPAAVIGFLT